MSKQIRAVLGAHDNFCSTTSLMGKQIGPKQPGGKEVLGSQQRAGGPGLPFLPPGERGRQRRLRFLPRLTRQSSRGKMCLLNFLCAHRATRSIRMSEQIRAALDFVHGRSHVECRSCTYGRTGVELSPRVTMDTPHFSELSRRGGIPSCEPWLSLQMDRQAECHMSR
jgi:hypothetical protein